jgi:hypothetical protein
MGKVVWTNVGIMQKMSQYNVHRPVVTKYICCVIELKSHLKNLLELDRQEVLLLFVALFTTCERCGAGLMEGG